MLNTYGFQVLRTLGKGNFNHVFQLYNDEYSIVAAKVMNDNEIDLNDLQTTIQKIQGDQNPFVLKYQSAEAFDRNAIILMDYANMKNLDMLIETKKDIPIPIIRAVMRQTLEGLSLIHEKGIVHGNIKGQNILLHCPP
ncbi:MAG: hypothetical protein EZS28_045693, partial [Streblomastix strix]